MKIKIRVKTILKLSLLALFIFIVLIPFGTLQIAKYLDRKNSDKAIVFYEGYLSKAIKFQDYEALYNYADNLIGYPYRYTIMMQGYGGSGDKTTLEDIDKAKAALEEIIKKGKGDYFVLAYMRLMDINISSQNPKELIDWINWGKDSEDSNIKYASDLYNSYYHFINRDYLKANEILDIYDGNEIADYKYYFLRGYIALFEGDFNNAKDYFEKGNQMGVNKFDETLFGTATHQNRLFWIEEYMKDQMGDYKVRGRVTFNGEPMPFVEVYIQDSNGGYRSSGEEFIGITDVNGEFETIGFREGRYDIGIGISDSILYDKVFLTNNDRFIDIDKNINYDFAFVSPIKVSSPTPGLVLEHDEFKVAWDEVEGVSYYDIQTIAFENNDKNSGSSMRFSIMDSSIYGKFTDNEIVMDLNMLKKRTGSFMWSGEEMIVNPGAILGNLINGYEYPIVVNAYDEDHNLIGSSLSINSYYDNMPSIKLAGELSEGEKLISSKQYVKAINYYNGVLEKDPNNEEALIYLSKMYYVSYKRDMADYDKALEYAIRYYEIKDDRSLIFNVIEFMDHDAHRKHKDLIINFLDNIDVEIRGEDYYFNKAKFYLSIRDYVNAREAFGKSYFGNTNLLFIDLYLGDLDSALSRLEEGIDLYRMDKISIRDSIKGLIKDDNLSEDYGYFKEILDVILSQDVSDEEGISIYNKTIIKIENLNLKALLNEIRLYKNWDMED